MAIDTFFQLPIEIIQTLTTSFPSREPQIRSLATLIDPRAAPCRNLVIHGTESTGKTAITSSLLQRLSSSNNNRVEGAQDCGLNYVVIKSIECVTARHLFERTISSVARVLDWQGDIGKRCENLAQLTVDLSKMLKYVDQPQGWRFVLVFDGIDRQKEAPPTLLPALARLSEIIPNLTTIFVTTSPHPDFLRTSAPHLHFPPYTKPEYLSILSSPSYLPETLPNTTEAETNDLWTRFCAAVHDSVTNAASRTLPSFHQACETLWPRFTEGIRTGMYAPREFSKLLIASRTAFQDENLLNPGIVRPRARILNEAARASGEAEAATGGGRTTRAAQQQLTKPSSTTTASADLSALLPPSARILLLAAYLASHNTARHDQTLFSTWHHARRRRGGGIIGRRGPRSKHRKIARKLLGPGVFTLERMVAIHAAVWREWVADGEDGKGGAVDGDVGMAIATLASLRLLIKVGVGAGAEIDRGGRWRVNVGWEVVRGLGRSMGVEVEEWLIE